MGALGGLLGTSWALLGISWALGGLLERSSMTFGAIFDAMGAILEASWTVLKPSWRRFGSSWGPDRSPKVTLWGSKTQMDLLRRLELKMAKPQKLSTVRRISMICEVPGLLLEVKIATKSCLGAFGSTFELSWCCWRLPKGSWKHLGALLEALGTLLQRFRGGE